PFAIGFPVLVHLFAFSVLASAVVVGLVLCSLAVFALHATGWKGAIVAVPALTFSFGIYQPIVLYPVSLILAVAAFAAYDVGWRFAFKCLIQFVIVFVTACVLAVLIWKAW